MAVAYSAYARRVSSWTAWSSSRRASRIVRGTRGWNANAVSSNAVGTKNAVGRRTGRIGRAPGKCISPDAVALDAVALRRRAANAVLEQRLAAQAVDPRAVASRQFAAN